MKAKEYVRIARSLLYELKNRALYGAASPRFAERVWINPSDCNLYIGNLGRSHSGAIYDGAWPPSPRCQVASVYDLVKIKACYAHWRDGVPWEETGVYEHIESKISQYGKWDDCRDMDDVITRYKRLDALFIEIKNSRRLKTKSELHRYHFREYGGICVHVGPKGVLYFSGGGCHRLAIAKILELPLIPVQLGCVHKESLGVLKYLRSPQVNSSRMSSSPPTAE